MSTTPGAVKRGIPIPKWFELAKNENLIDSLLSDPSRVANLDDAMSLLPSDNARILYLRGAKKLHVEPDEPAFYQGIAASLIVAEILQTGVEEFLEKMQQAESGAMGLLQALGEQVARMRRQTERIETSQTSYSDNISKHLASVENLAKHLPDQIKSVLMELVVAVREQMTQDATRALEAAAPDIINQRADRLVKLIEGACKTVVGSAEHLKAFTEAVREIVGQEKDVVIGRLRMERWKLKFGGLALIIGFVLGSIMGVFVFQHPGHATIDSSTIQEINAGYDFLQAYPNLDSRTRAAVDKALIQSHQQALNAAVSGGGSH